MIIAAIVIALIVFVVILLAVLNAASARNDYEQAVEDAEQEAYLREWMKRKREKDARRAKP